MQHTTSRLTAPLLLLAGSLASLFALATALAADVSAVVHKPSVDVHSGPDFHTPTIAKLNQDAPVRISGQQGLWFQKEACKEPGVAEVIISKQRNGPTGTVKLAFISRITKFESLAHGGGDY